MGKKRVRYRTGDLVAIPLPDGRFGYGRLYHNLTIGLFQAVSAELLPPAELIRHPIGPILSFDAAAVDDGRWPVIGSFPFASEEDAWGPPSRGIGDFMWVRGEMVPARTAKEKKRLADLEDGYLRDPDDVIRRLYEANSWPLPSKLKPKPKPGGPPPDDPWADFGVLFENDTAALVKATYEEASEDGATVVQASKAVLGEFEAELEDTDDRPRVLIPVAVLQLIGRKKVQATIRDQVLGLLSDKAVVRDYPVGTSGKAKVKQALEKLKVRLENG
jgi:hypothetical protein